MIYIICALGAEAKPLIKEYGLKKDPAETMYDLYRSVDNDLGLFLIRGTGPVKAAAATSYLCAKYVSSGKDILINIGCAAGRPEDAGKIFLCGSVYDCLSGHVYYPDNICRSDMASTNLTSVGTVLDTLPSSGFFEDMGENSLYDMEGAAIFETAAPFLGTGRLFFLKAVSDSGAAGSAVTPESISSLIEENIATIKGFINTLKEYPLKDSGPDISKLAEDFSAEIHASETMKHKVRQLFTYLSLTGMDLMRYVQSLHSDGLLPAKDRNAGKKILERMYNELL